MATCTQNCAPGVVGNPVRNQPGLFAAVRNWFEIQRLGASLAREREQLLTLPEAILRDMGITRAQAEAEARRRDIPPVRLGWIDRTNA